MLYQIVVSSLLFSSIFLFMSVFDMQLETHKHVNISVSFQRLILLSCINWGKKRMSASGMAIKSQRASSVLILKILKKERKTFSALKLGRVHGFKNSMGR